MADSKLSALPAKTTLVGTEETYINDGGVSKKTTMGTIKDFIVGFANVFTTSQVVTPLTDVISLVLRRNGAAQTANIIEIQTEANALLASVDKAGTLLTPKIVSTGSLTLDPVGKLNLEGATAYNIGKAVNFEMGDGIIGWRDLIADIVLRGNVSSDPVWTQIGATPFWGYKSTIGKKCYITFHINHDYYPGGQILLHTHWVSSGANTTNSVNWKFSYVVAKGHNQASGGNFAFASPSIVTSETVSGGQYRHMISEISASIDVTNVEIDSLIMVVIERITNGGTDNTDDIFMLTADCHYQASRFASPNKAPNFYA